MTFSLPSLTLTPKKKELNGEPIEYFRKKADIGAWEKNV